MEGKLTLVPTPIGNLEDITLRGLDVLRSAETILCEDTRHTSKLLKHHGIDANLRSFHQHNEHKVSDGIIASLKEGSHYALVSDAGMPGISDPGYLLVRAAIEENIKIEVLPGASAVLPALVGSGLPCEKYLYLGFPPQKKGRKTFWDNLTDFEHTMVIYESPHRIEKALSEAVSIFGKDRLACVARELSKMHETFHRGTLQELHQFCSDQGFKGEIVLIIEGRNHANKRQKS